jgi:hypothetical protein
MVNCLIFPHAQVQACRETKGWLAIEYREGNGWRPPNAFPVIHSPRTMWTMLVNS